MVVGYYEPFTGLSLSRRRSTAAAHLGSPAVEWPHSLVECDRSLLGFMFSPANSVKGFTGLYLSPAFTVETPRRPAP